MYSDKDYLEFSKRMEERYPEMFIGRYGGFCVDAGWWPVLEALCNQIDGYTKWQNNTREALLQSNPHNRSIPESVPQVVVEQIKEKFGGLRFYYQGGDDHIAGMVRMAEMWAGSICEECGKPGTKSSSGWIKTLCKEHHEAREARYARDNGLEL